MSDVFENPIVQLNQELSASTFLEKSDIDDITEQLTVQSSVW